MLDYQNPVGPGDLWKGIHVGAVSSNPRPMGDDPKGQGHSVDIDSLDTL